MAGALTAAASAGLLSAAWARPADFGRWQVSPGSCQWQRGHSRLWFGCQGLRLEQNLEGQLSVRFLAGGRVDPIALEQLVFAGTLEPGQVAMHCNPEGRCQPHWPARLTVASVAVASFDRRGLAMGLPHTRLARGHCQLERGLVHCQALGVSGERWVAEAML